MEAAHERNMMGVIHREHAFWDMFAAYLLTRNIRKEEDLIDQLFNASDKRLARVLLLLAHFGKDGKPEVAIPKNDLECLASTGVNAPATMLNNVSSPVTESFCASRTIAGK